MASEDKTSPMPSWTETLQNMPESMESWWDWLVANPVYGILIAIVAFIGKDIASWAINKAADYSFGKLRSRNNKKAEISAEPTSALVLNRTGEEFRELGSEDLISYYDENEPAYRVEIAGKPWKFAACRAIEPSGIGAVRDQKISMKYRGEMFQLDDELTALTAPRKKALLAAKNSESLFDGKPFRISNLSVVNGRTVIEVGRCSYFDSLITNFSMDFVLPEKDQTLREILHGTTGAFESLGNSRLPNHMGLVVIIETSDGRLIVQRRSKDVQIRPETLSASVSGTFEDNDLNKGSRAFPFHQALQGLIREVDKELGRSYENQTDELYFMGLMREFRRGGFPDFYFYFHSQHTFDEVHYSSKFAAEQFEIDDLDSFYLGGQAFLKNPEQERMKFEEQVSRILQKIDGQANLTLSLSIGLYFEMILRRASAQQVNEQSHSK